MKNKALLLFFSLLIGFSYSQEISKSESFEVEGYSIRGKYPSKVIPVDQDNFAFIEFWKEGQGRRDANFYIQCYSKSFSEQWYKPITASGSPTMNPVDLFKLKNKIVVLGHQLNPSTKIYDTKAQFFTIEGEVSGTLQKLSCYDSKAKKGYSETFKKSPDNSKVLWMGSNPGASASKRNYYFSVLGNEGKPLWRKKLVPPGQDRKYEISQAIIDNQGNLYCLMNYSGLTSELKDSIYKPFVAMYQYSTKKWSEASFTFKNSILTNSQIIITNKGALRAITLISDGGKSGFENGKHFGKETIKYNKIGCQRFNINKEIIALDSTVSDIPEGLSKRYTEKGADFSLFDIKQKGKQILFLMEEHYTKEHNKNLQYRYNDLVAASFNSETGEMNWMNFLGKKQSDAGSGNLMSYVPAFAANKFNIIFLSGRGAQGQIINGSFDLATGATKKKKLVINQDASWLFYTGRSSQIGPLDVILMGIGNPVGNDYKLVRISY